MSIYMTIDFRKEIRKRLNYLCSIKENLRDVEAELEEVQKRNPLGATKGSGDSMFTGNTGSSNQSKSVALMNRESKLIELRDEYKAIVNDHERGWRLLTERERKVIEMRYFENHKQDTVARALNCDRKTIYAIESEALRKLESQMLQM